MKTGTVKSFNLQKGYGFIHPDDGGPNIFVDVFAAECAGMSGLKVGQRLWFKIQSSKRAGHASAVSLAPLVFESIRYNRRSSKLRPTATTPPLDGRFATTNPFDSIFDLISLALGTRLRL